MNRQTRKLPERVAGTEHEMPKPSRKLIKDEPPSGRNWKRGQERVIPLALFSNSG